MSRQTIALDLDGVLHKYSGWKGEDVWDEPLPGAKEFLEELKKKGYRIVIYTTRKYEGVLNWLKKYDLETYIFDISTSKPKAIAYVDDRGVRFKGDYAKALKDIEEKTWWE